jgi:hypothetical protein
MGEWRVGVVGLENHQTKGREYSTGQIDAGTGNKMKTHRRWDFRSVQRPVSVGGRLLSIDVDGAEIVQLCELLCRAGLVKQEYGDHYEISQWGALYLDGEVCAESRRPTPAPQPPEVVTRLVRRVLGERTDATGRSSFYGTTHIRWYERNPVVERGQLCSNSED